MRETLTLGIMTAMIRNLCLYCVVLGLTGCGLSGPLYLTKDYKAQHQTVEQQEAPSDSLLPIDSNQRILRTS